MARTVVVGLDGFHTDLFEYTPTIRELYVSCPSNELESTTPPMTAPAWASFQTGKQQGRHGVFDFVRYDDSYSVSLLDGQALQSVTFYELLTDAGVNCYLQNLPFATPPRIKGDVMPSWLDGPEVTPHPENLPARYGIEPPKYPSFSGSPTENVRELRECFSHNCDVMLTILSATDHDFLFHLVSVTDWLQHIAYRSLATGTDDTLTNAAQSLLSDVDDYVSQLRKQLSDDDLVLLSDHGFRLYDGSFYVNDWLSEHGYLTMAADGVRFGTKDDTTGSTMTVDAGSIGRWLRRTGPFWDFLRPVKEGVANLFSVKFTAESSVDMESTVAYCQSKDEAAIRLNPNNCDDRTATVDRLMAEFRDEPHIHPHRRDNLYEGPHVDLAGDIVVTSEKYLPQRGPIGEIYSESCIAHHSPNGIVIGVGAGFNDIPDCPGLIDLAPTLLHKYGLKIPSDVDGRVLEKWLTTDRSPVMCDPVEPPSITQDKDSDSEVTNRLESLGYL